MGPAPNSLRSLRSLRSNRRREVSRRSALSRAAPNPCAPRRPPRGPIAIRSFASQTSPVHADAQRGEWRRNRSMCAACPRHGNDRPNPCSRSVKPKSAGVRRFCFGYFHLTRQMFAQRGDAHFAKQSYAATKVTRPPGRNPGAPAGRQKKHTTRQRHKQSKASIPQPERLIVKTAPRCQS